MGEVLDGLARAKGKDRDESWREESIQVRAVVRGAEGELAKLVNGLLRIAKGLGIKSLPSEVEPQRQRTDESPQTTPKARPTQINRSLPILPSIPPILPATSFKPAALFASRPLHPTPTLPPLKPSARSISSRSSSSSHSSHSTSLTVPSHRPSLAKELERSGTLSPPPRMPGSPRKNERFSMVQPASGERRARSTLQLMREKREESVKRGESGEEEGNEGDVFLTPRKKTTENRRETTDEESKAARKPRGDVEELLNPESNDSEAGRLPGSRRSGGMRREGENRKGKGKEREERGDKSRPRSKEAESSMVCCEGCGSTLLSEGFVSSTSSTSTSPLEFEKPVVKSRDRKAFSSSHKQRTASSSKKEDRKAKERNEEWCECHSIEGEEADASEEAGSSSSTLVKADKRPSRNSTRPRDPGKTGRSRRSTRPSKPALIPPSPAARRVRLGRLPFIELAEEAALLSVHGESEIERFETSHQSSHSVLAPDPLPSTSLSTPQPHVHETVPAAIPSPYTMLLLAQRAKLAEKLRALERRERDRVAAREAQVASVEDSNATALEV